MYFKGNGSQPSPSHFLKKKSFLLLFTIITFFSISQKCLALDELKRFWLAINAQQTLSEDKKWLSFLYSQLRLIDQSHPWQATIFETGIGYRLLNDKSIWFGYRWTGNNPNNGFSQQNRLFQQFIWQMKLGKQERIIFRARLEESQLSHQSQIAFRFRQRVALELDHAFIYSKLFPFFYDEVFFQLNNTNYTSSKFVSQNRVFVGFNFHLSKENWWEIGYINQFQMRTPLNNQNLLSHILSLTYNFS